MIDEEATLSVPSLPSTAVLSSQEAKPAALSSANQAPTATQVQEATPEAASLQKQAVVKQKGATPTPVSSAQEGTPSVPQGSATTLSSSRVSNGERPER
jgi:hypothetical protein